jgi:hypothetical protein
MLTYARMLAMRMRMRMLTYAGFGCMIGAKSSTRASGCMTRPASKVCAYAYA